MKYLFLAAAIATRLALAQELSSLPACGQTCIRNMLAKAEELGCPGADVACLCLNEDFSNGITDCTNESCLGGEDKKSVIDTGVQYCADALAQVSGGSIVATASVTALASAISGISASKTSGASASKTSEVSASKTSQVSASESSKASATTKEESTVTKTGLPLSTASVVVATLTDSAGKLITSTIGDLVGGGAVAITTTDSRGTTFITTATALPPKGNSTGAGGAGKASGVPVTTTNSLGSTIITTQTPSAGASETPSTTGGAGAGAGGSPTTAAATTSATGAAIRLAAAGCAGFVGMAAMVLL